MLPEERFLDLVAEDLKSLKRDNYLLEVLVHKKYSALHCNEKADREFLFRKELGKKMTTLSREELEALLKPESEANRYGLITYSFAPRDRDTFELIFIEGWGNRCEAVRYDVKVTGERLWLKEDTIDLVWHM